MAIDHLPYELQEVIKAARLFGALTFAVMNPEPLKSSGSFLLDFAKGGLKEGLLATQERSWERLYEAVMEEKKRRDESDAFVRENKRRR